MKSILTAAAALAFIPAAAGQAPTVQWCHYGQFGGSTCFATQNQCQSQVRSFGGSCLAVTNGSSSQRQSNVFDGQGAAAYIMDRAEQGRRDADARALRQQQMNAARQEQQLIEQRRGDEARAARALAEQREENLRLQRELNALKLRAAKEEAARKEDGSGVTTDADEGSLD